MLSKTHKLVHPTLLRVEKGHLQTFWLLEMKEKSTLDMLSKIKRV